MSAAAQKVRPKAAPAAPDLRRAATQDRAALSGSPRYLRASLRVGGVNDPEERQAEHAASVVASGGQYKVHDPGGSASLRAAVAPPVADPAADGRIRKAVAPPITDPAGVVRRAPMPAGGAADAEAARRIEAARSSVARPLPAPVKARLEHGFGHKMDGVRVHTGPAARAAASAIGARAYTEGNRITLGHGESEHDLHLMAHEATHVVQNRAAVPQPAAARRAHADSGDIRRAEADPAAVASGPIRRFGIDTVLDFLADKANMIPGFRMFTIILGVNPVNMSSVDRSAANVLRAVVELMPGGALIVSALDKYGVFEKAGAWVSQQIDTLGLVGASIGHAVSEFIDSLHWRDALHPGDVWDRAKRIFTDPIDRIIAFIHSLVDGVIQFVKDAVLRPLAELASKTRAWDLLIALLGKNPITGDPVPQTAETLIGGFMKLIGQEEVWQNMQKSHAVARAFAWFKNAMATVVAFAMELPGLFLAALKSFSISDLLDLPGAIGRVLGMFGDFAGRFIAWAADAVWKLLEIIFDVVSPAAWSYIKKTGAALKSILKNPLPFVHNLVHAGKLAFQNFADHIGTHLKTGLIDWLTGAITGVYIPKAFSLIEMGKFALSVLGITWAQIRGKIVKALGPTGEKIMAGLEKTFDVVVALVTGGPAAAWEVIKENLTNLKDMVVDGVIGFVTDTIVKKAIPKIVSMFIPGAGFISAILSIYDTVMVFVQKLSKIIAAVTAFIDSIVAIAAGMVESAAQKVESTLASLLSLAISFLAGFLGLGNIAAKIKEVIEKVRAMVDKALDKAIGWIVGKAKSLFAKLFGGKDDKDKKDAGKASGVARKQFSLPEEGHTVTATAKDGKLQVVIASDREGEILAMLADAAAEVSADPARNPKQKADTLGDLIGARAMVKSMGEDFEANAKKGQDPTDYPQWAEVRLTQIVNILTHLGADGIKTFRDFKGVPLARRYLPPGYDVREKLYLRGSGWSGAQASIVTSGSAAVQKDVNDVIANRGTNPAVADAAWDRLVKGLRVPDGATKATLSLTQLASTAYDVDHIQTLSIHWQSSGGNDTGDAGRWALSTPSSLRYITKRDNLARTKGSYVDWVGVGFTSVYAQGGLANAKQIDGQPLLDAARKPI